jgi:hypothetical protein
LSILLFVASLPAGVSVTAAVDMRSDLALLGQVREGDQSGQTEAPIDLYGKLGLSDLRYGSTFDSYFRAEHDFGIDDSATDFYAGYLNVPRAIPGVDMTLGRQLLSEGPTGLYVADAGKIRVDPGLPVSFELFGGAPRYFEPTDGGDIISQDETIWGGSLRAARWNRTSLSVGYFGLDRADHVLKHLITGSASRSFLELPGLPTFYGNIAYDADLQNLDIGTAGVDILVPQPQLHVNVEGTYYKPQDNEKDRPERNIDEREDALFEGFSTSELVQWHGSVSRPITPALASVLDYSFQHYAQQRSHQYENSHIASAGLLWLPGGDGLEIVKVEYYVINGDGGSVNGGKVYYESRVYERLVFRTKLDLTGYEKENHESGVAVGSLLGLGYMVLPGLFCELNLEANHNDRLDEDFRFGFFINYRFRHQIATPADDRGTS